MKLRNTLLWILSALAVMLPAVLFAQDREAGSDAWTATDGLGRKLPGPSEAGEARQGKYVGMFYWTWHTDGNATFSPVMNITQILQQHPEAATDGDHPAWQGITPGVFWWDEPLFGYYRTTDAWILRKHAEMLADAGIDVVFFDCTNGSLTWKTSYSKLLEVWDQARQDGVKAPQVVFLLPFSAGTDALTSLYELYTELYQPGLYKDQWFMWNGKPLVMAYPESLVPKSGSDAGLRFTATAPFYAVNATCPSWGNQIGNITFRLYKWNETYAQSVSGNPIAEKTFVNFSDNQKLALNFDAQEAGDYVWELSNGTEQVGVWKWTDSHDPVTSYYNGTQVSGAYESEISYDSILNFTPLTMGSNHTPVAVVGPIDQQTVNSMKEFFTFRPGQPDYINGPSRKDQWGWLEIYPQHGYGPTADQGYEEATVGIAQNASDVSGGHASGFNTAATYGRSYTREGGQDTRPEAYLKGLNFQEQWKRAREIDPDLVFVTGWNEWIAGRLFNWDVKPFAFVDEYSAEKSRDIEPVKSWGNKGDVYYMQLIGNVRRFKGMQKADTVSGPMTMSLEDFQDWAGVKPEFRAYKGNTLHRNHAGQGTELVYTNTSGRNDIVSSKVARDSSYVYFMAETADNLTDKSDPQWMRLFIDTDRNKATGWEGYDFVVNRLNPGDSAFLEKSSASWNWSLAGKVAYAISGKQLAIKIPRSLLGLPAGEGINFEFKWSDNMQEEGNIMDFYVSGDVAPGGRFNYVYKVEWTDDRYRFADDPQGVNPGLKCEAFSGIFDTIPSFFSQKITGTTYPENFTLPSTGSADVGVRYTGFIDVPVKDIYTFSVSTDLAARLYIGNMPLVDCRSGSGTKSGSIRLMPGKHAITVDYIGTSEHAHALDVEMESASIPKAPVSSSRLFKYNQVPSVSLAFHAVQNYFSTFDTVAVVNATDPDGTVGTVEIFDNDLSLLQQHAAGCIIKDLGAGEHSLFARVTDNDGAVSESNVLNLSVNPPITLPGKIPAEAYRRGKGVSVQNSSDTDGGLSIKVAYGWTDYPVEVGTTGNYQFRFRVLGSNGTKTVTIKVNNVIAGSVDLGNTGTSQAYCDVVTQLRLTAGNQVIRLEFNGILSLHYIDISFLPTGLDAEPESMVKVLPNPSSGAFVIQTGLPYEKMALYDVLGNLACQQPVRESNTRSVVGSELKPGIYLLVITTPSGSKKTLKLVKSNE